MSMTFSEWRTVARAGLPATFEALVDMATQEGWYIFPGEMAVMVPTGITAGEIPERDPITEFIMGMPRPAGTGVAMGTMVVRDDIGEE